MHLYYRLRKKDNTSERPPGYSKETCFISFIKACQIAEMPMPNIVCDGDCPDWLKEPSVNLSNVGGAQSFWYTYNEAIKHPDGEWVYFSEDDYLYLPDAMAELNLAIKSLGVDFLTLYDHPDRYSNLPEHNLTDGKDTIRLSGARHWRTVPSSCMTFAASVKALKACYELFDKWTNRDGYTVSWELFPRIQGLKGDSGLSYKLMGPMPSLITHCVVSYFAPCVDWKFNESI